MPRRRRMPPWSVGEVSWRSPDRRATPVIQPNRRSLSTILPEVGLIRCILSTDRSLHWRVPPPTLKP